MNYLTTVSIYKQFKFSLKSHKLILVNVQNNAVSIMNSLICLQKLRLDYFSYLKPLAIFPFNKISYLKVALKMANQTCNETENLNPSKLTLNIYYILQCF